MTQEEQKQTTEQDSVRREENGRLLPGGANINPEGKGGFQENPENINAGGRPKNLESFSYWMNTFKDMTVSKFLTWEDDNPEDIRSVASSLAYARVAGARTDLYEFREVADRTEGKAPQTIIHEGGFFADTRLEIVEVANDENEPEQEAEANA